MCMYVPVLTITPTLLYSVDVISNESYVCVRVIKVNFTQVFHIIIKGVMYGVCQGVYPVLRCDKEGCSKSSTSCDRPMVSMLV